MATPHAHGPNGLVPIHVAVRNPSEMRKPHPKAPDDAHRRFAKSAKYADILWSERGAEPRWLGMDTSTCVAAINPSRYHNHGADELERFTSGAAWRSEPALIIATIGNVEEEGPWNVFHGHDAHINLHDDTGLITGKRLPAGSEIFLAPDVDETARDLGRRLQSRPADAPWWSMDVRPVARRTGPREPAAVQQPQGELLPILVDNLGEPVVARWTPADGHQIWYLIPDMVDWTAIVDWIVQRALPTHIPDALRRARSRNHVDPDLETTAEAQARAAIADLERRYAAEKATLQADLDRARTEAEPIRTGLLYGTGSELADAVAAVLRAAGFQITDLDEELGSTQSADLLATLNQNTCLIEVKSASGAAAEKLVSHLQRHLQTWPQIRPHQPVTCSALIVNHQHRLDPAQRARDVYQRAAFVETLPFPVLTTTQLFQWWRTRDRSAVRTAILGPAYTAQTSTASTAESLPRAPRRRRPWFRPGGPE